MMIISLAVASTVFTLNIYKRGEKGEPVPAILRKIFFDLVGKLLFVRVKINSDVNLSVKDAFEMNHTYMAYAKKLRKVGNRTKSSRGPHKSFIPNFIYLKHPSNNNGRIKNK